MAISFLRVGGVKEGSNEDVRGALVVHHLDFLGVPDDQANLEILSGLPADVPDWLHIFRGHLGRVYFNPTLEDTLGDSRGRMVDLAVFHGLITQGSPLGQEIPVLQVDPTSSNQVITKQVIVVHDVNLDRWAAWEDNWEVEVHAKLGFGVIKRVVVSLIELLISARNLDVWIRETSNISRGKIVSIDHIDANDALRRLKK